MGNARNGLEEPNEGLRGRSRNDLIHVDGHDGYGDSWRIGCRLEMPMFTGKCPEGWIFRAELFFEMNRLTEGEKLPVAGVSFEEKALAWYR